VGQEARPGYEVGAKDWPRAEVGKEERHVRCTMAKNGAIYGMTKGLQRMAVGGAKITMKVADKSGTGTYRVAKRMSMSK
jgi:hypothetical protein